jgi:large subunit ribosomal protein L22
MKVQALTKYARMSPTKIRPVAKTLVGRLANEALEVLRIIPRKSARLIAKTLQSAIANAENNHKIASNTLYILNTTVEEGPSSRRFRPVARGQAHPFKKRTSHIKIILSEK